MKRTGAKNEPLKHSLTKTLLKTISSEGVVKLKKGPDNKRGENDPI